MEPVNVPRGTFSPPGGRAASACLTPPPTLALSPFPARSLCHAVRSARRPAAATDPNTKR